MFSTFLTIVSNTYLQVAAGILASALLWHRRYASRFAVALLAGLVAAALIASTIMVLHAHLVPWLWYACWSIPAYLVGAVLRAVYLLCRLYQKQRSLQHKAAMWHQSARTQLARPFDEVAAHIQQAIEGERHKVSLREARRALRKAHYPRTQSSRPAPKPLPKMQQSRG